MPVDEVAAGSTVTNVLRERLEHVLGSTHAGIPRLVHARVSVAFVVDGARPVTVDLHRRPYAVDGSPGDVELRLTSEQAHAFASGDLSLVAAASRGEIGYSGPFRSFAEIEPILRSALADGASPRTVIIDPSSAGTHRTGYDADLMAIETRDLHKAFGTNQILRGLEVRIPEGVISVVLGPSGTGKSVLLQHIIGLMRPDRGKVLVRGRDLSGMKERDLLDLRRGIGVMFQDGALFSSMNVYDNVAFPLRQHTDFSETEVALLVDSHLDSVGLAHAKDRMPPELSGGMRKRAGLARALALDPGIILCDEPDSGLDPIRTALLGEVLVDQHERQGGTMLVVTHNIALARSIADHMSIVYRGKVVTDGLAADVLASEEPFVRQFLTGDSVGPLGMDA